MNLVASTLTNGASASFASRRLISVLPQPVGPIIRMFLGVTSSRSSGAELLAAPAVAKRDRDRALGVVLADDMLVERGDDRLGGELVVQHFGGSPPLWGMEL